MKSKVVYNSKLKPLYTAFLHSIKLSRYKMGIKFDKDPLAVEQNNYASKNINIYIVYDLGAQARNPTNNFEFQIDLSGATSVVNNSDKEKYVYTSYGITFSSIGPWRFDNEIARNFIGAGGELCFGERKPLFFPYYKSYYKKHLL